MKLHVELDTHVAPERVSEALLDFTDRRPRLWRNLDSRYYQVHRVAATSAEVTEGNIGRPKIWAREHYDWSIPGRIEWRSVESNYCTPGSGIVVQILPRDDGGSHLVMDWERHAATWRGVLVNAMVGIAGQRLMRLGMRRDLARIDAILESTG